MQPYHVVIDTNVLVAAFKSAKGASSLLLRQVGQNRVIPHISVPLFLEYEEQLARILPTNEVETVLAFLYKESTTHKIYYLQRPALKDADDEMVLEVAITGNCSHIVSFNYRDLKGAEHFGIRVVTPKEFLQQIGLLK